MNKRETDLSILAKQIDSYSQSLAMFCQRFLEGMPIVELASDDNEKIAKFTNYLSSFSFNDDFFQRFLINCTLFAKSSPAESYHILNESLPQIDYKKTSPPTPSNVDRVYFTDFILNVNYNHIHVKAALKHFVERCISGYLKELLTRTENPQNSGMISIINETIEHLIMITTSDKYIMASIAQSSVAWCPTIKLISKIIPDKVFNEVTKYFQNETVTDQQLYYLFIFFSKVIYPKDVDLSGFAVHMYEIYNLSTKNSDMLKHCSTFIVNLLTQILENRKTTEHKSSNKLLISYYDTTKHLCTGQTLTCSSLALLAVLTNYPPCIDFFKTTDIFIETFLDPLFASVEASLVLESVAVKMRKSKTSLDYLLQWLRSKKTLIGKAQNELSDIFVEVFLKDPRYFLDVLLPALSNDPIEFKSYATAFFKAFKKLLSKLKNENSKSKHEKSRSKSERRNSKGEKSSSKSERSTLKSERSTLKCERSNSKRTALYHELKQKAKQLVIFEFQMRQYDGSTCAILYTTNSFTLALTAAVEDKDITMKSMIEILPETSYPIFKFDPPKISVASSIASWYTATGNLNAKAFPNEPNFVQNESAFRSISYEPILFAFLSLSIYLEPDEMLIRIISSAVVSNSPHSGSLAIRTLQAMIHLHPNMANMIIETLADFLMNKPVTFQAVVALIIAFTFVFEASQFERVKIDASVLDSLRLAALIGLCIPISSVRNQVFEMDKILTNNCEKDSFHSFFYFGEKDMNQVPKRNAIRALSLADDAEIKILPDISFSDIALSNVPNLYLFYLAAIGDMLIQKRIKKNINFLEKAFKMFYKQLDSKGIDDTFLLNIFTVLLSIANVYGETHENSDLAMRRIQIAAKGIIKKFIETKKMNYDIILIGCFSTLSSSLHQLILPLLAQNDQAIQRVLTFVLANLVEKGSIKILDDKGKIEPYLYILLHSTLSFCFSKSLISHELDFAVASKLVSESVYHMVIRNFCLILKAVFRQKFKRFITPGRFICKQTYLTLKEESPFSDDKWFVFFCNLAYTESSFTHHLFEAFTAWTKLFPIPDKYFSTFCSKLFELSRKHPKLNTSIFGRYSDHLIRYFITESQTKFHAFLGLACQVVSKKETILDIIPQDIDLQENPIILLFYKNCGSLVALAMYHITSKQSSHRNVSLKFLYFLALIIGIMRNDKSITNMLIGVKRITKTITSSFSIFINQDIHHLNKLLSKNLSFCAEQFASQCLQIIKASSKRHKMSNSSYDSSIESGSLISGNNLVQSGSEINRLTRAHSKSKLSSTSERLMLFGQNFLSDLNSRASNRSQKCEHVSFDKLQMLSSFISHWICPISYDLQRIGICSYCEPEFLQFGIYTFIDSLIGLCNIHGITGSIATILDILIDNAADMFLLCLFNIQNQSIQQSTNALLCLTYIYHRIPWKLIEMVLQFLKINSWYYFEVQLSKIDQLFDMKKFLETLSGIKKRKSSDQSNEDEAQQQNGFPKIIIFVLNLILTLKKENPDHLIPILSKIIIFCFIHTTTFPEPCDLLLSRITKLKRANTPKKNTGYGIMSEFDIEDKWKLSELLPYIQKYSKGDELYLLQWGLCCGDLVVAAKALMVFNRLGYVYPIHTLPSLFRTMQIICELMHERTDSSNFDQFNQMWMLRIVGENNNRPSSISIVNYLGMCLEMIYSCLTKTTNPPESIFWTATSFLMCNTPEFSCLFAVSLLIIVKMLEFENILPELCKKEDFEGLLPLLLNLHLDSASSLNTIFKIIVGLFMSDCIQLLMKRDSTASIALFILVPYLRENSATLDKKFVDHLKMHLKNMKNMKNEDNRLEEVVINALDKEKPSKSLSDFSRKFLNSVSHHEMKLILVFYSQIAQHGNCEQRNNVYILTDAIMNDSRSTKPIADVLSTILYYSVIDKENEYNEYRLNLLKNSAVARIQIVKPAKTMINRPSPAITFPNIDLGIDRGYGNWSPQREDVFESVDCFPPLFVSDISFVGCKLLLEVQKAVDKVESSPFTSWSQTLFQAQLQSNSEIEGNDDRIVIVRLESKKYLNDLLATLRETMEKENLNLSDRNDNVVVDVVQNAFNVQDDQKKMFYTPVEEMMMYGADILSEYSLPNIFV